MWISIYAFQHLARDPDTDEPLDDISTLVDRVKDDVVASLVSNGAIDYIKQDQPPKRVLHYRGPRDSELLEDVNDKYAYNFNANTEGNFKPDDEGFIIELRAHVKPGDSYFPRTEAEA